MFTKLVELLTAVLPAWQVEEIIRGAVAEDPFSTDSQRLVEAMNEVIATSDEEFEQYCEDLTADCEKLEQEGESYLSALSKEPAWEDEHLRLLNQIFDVA